MAPARRMPPLPHLLAATPEDLQALCGSLGEPRYRAAQILDWVFAKRAASFDRMANLPKELRRRLAEAARLRVLSVRKRETASDGLTEKWLFATEEGHGLETVWIREKERRTLCLSCMLGCQLGCVFCATAQGPFIRPLTVGEMVEQAVRAEEETGERATNIVFMGMGEPFLHYDAVLAAARRLNAATGLGIGARHITLSTVGVIPGIERLAGEPEDFRLAVSLHAPDQALRERIVPAAKRWKLRDLLPALRRYCRETRREVTVEYVLIEGVNAGAGEADALARLLRDLPAKVNAIPLNPWPGCAGRAPAPAACRDFAARLRAAGLRVTLRMEKGREIRAACGQLRAVVTPPGGTPPAPPEA